MIRDLALVGMIAFLTAGPAAQGLADVARRGATRGPAPSSRTYTNADVEPARPVEPAAPPVSAAPESVPAAKSETATEADKAAAAPVTAAPAPILDAEAKAAQERQAAHARKFAGELTARLQQRQERVQALKKEFQTLQQAHAAGNPAATLAARDALQQTLSEAERELASAQRAVARASAPPKDTGTQTDPPPQPSQP